MWWRSAADADRAGSLAGQHRAAVHLHGGLGDAGQQAQNWEPQLRQLSMPWPALVVEMKAPVMQARLKLELPALRLLQALSPQPSSLVRDARVRTARLGLERARRHQPSARAPQPERERVHRALRQTMCAELARAAHRRSIALRRVPQVWQLAF